MLKPALSSRLLTSALLLRGNGPREGERGAGSKGWAVRQGQGVLQEQKRR